MIFEKRIIYIATDGTDARREAYKEQEDSFGYVIYEEGKEEIRFDSKKVFIHSAGVHRKLTKLRAINYNIPISIVHKSEHRQRYTTRRTIRNDF